MGLHPLILAGGSGTRLWPLSRELYPKQFLALAGEHSMLQETISRLDNMEEVSPPIIVCNEEHRFLAAEHVRQLGKTPLSIVLEPVGRNTAPALTLAALALANGCQHCDSDDPVMLVMPADHTIQDIHAFQAGVRKGAALADRGYIVTFGIVPTAPKTGYGYIKKGQALDFSGSNRVLAGENNAKEDLADGVSFRLEAFVEKPDETTAGKMLQTGDYLWNSGIFMMKVSVWLQELEHYRPDIAEVCRDAYSQGQLDGDFYRPDNAIFTSCPSDSIDYAVMEKVTGGPETDGSPPSPECAVVPLDVGWSDVGSWSELWERGEQDGKGNVIKGDVFTDSMKNSLLVSQHRLLAAVGLENIVVVETSDAVLVADKGRVQDVKNLVAQLKKEGRSEQENHRKVHRPWGSYETVDMGPRFQVKRLMVKPGAALSLQLHNHRAEHWVVVSGTAKVTRGVQEFLLTEDESAYVPVGTTHRLENPGTIPVEIIEVQSGSYLGEDDIVRLEDRYNRHMPAAPQPSPVHTTTS